MRQRLSPELFKIPVEDIKAGYYSDAYFLRTREVLERDNHNPRVLMQVFQRKNAVLCGIDEALAVIKKCSYNFGDLTIHALHDGDKIEPWETVLTIEGSLADFSHLETVYLGILARQTKIATNMRATVDAAQGKPIMFFPSRFDYYSTQVVDGYAAYIGGAQGVSTPANATFNYDTALGTIPHALIATYHGNTLAATKAFDKHIDSSIKRIALVDFDNDCVNTALEVAKELGDKLWAVRLDTSDTMIDASVIPYMGTTKPTGVCPQLVHNVRKALNAHGFNHVKIMVTGGFNPPRIKAFEDAKVPVDSYGVGGSLFEHNYHFTADIVMVDGNPCAKKGRAFRPNKKLEIYK